MAVMQPRHRSAPPYAYMYVQGLYEQVPAGSTEVPYPSHKGGFNRGHADAAGGHAYAGYPWAHVETEFAGGPDSINDVNVFKARGPVYHVPSMCPPADPIRWTDSGPLRPEMSMRTFAWTRWQNCSTQAARFFGQDPKTGRLNPSIGMHTNPPAPSTPDVNRGANKPYWWKQPRQDRLSRQRYRGQGYSQLTSLVENQPIGG